MPGTVAAFERRGAIAQVFIHPGASVHEGICTPIWGAPTHESIARKASNCRVFATRRRSPGAARVERLAPRWRPHLAARRLVAVPLADRRDPRHGRSRRVPARPRSLRFVVRRHRRQRDRGRGAARAARVLHALRDRLKRSVRIAWWPGHSTGRYAGSTWYADTFADEMDEWCLAHLNIDSPAAQARPHEEVMWMAEAAALHRRDRRRTRRERDAAAVRRRLLVQPDRSVGVLHAAVEHSESGARGARLLRGRRMRRQSGLAHRRMGRAWRMATSFVAICTSRRSSGRSTRRSIPSTTARRSLKSRLRSESIRSAAGAVDLAPVLADLRALRAAVVSWTAEAGRRMQAAPDDHALRRRLNATLRRLARILVPLNYARGERFDHDPAIKLPAVPRLEAAALVTDAAPAIRPFIRNTALVRERNKVRAMLRQALRECATIFSLGPAEGRAPRHRPRRGEARGPRHEKRCSKSPSSVTASSTRASRRFACRTTARARRSSRSGQRRPHPA